MKLAVVALILQILSVVALGIVVGCMLALWLSNAHGHDVALLPVHGWTPNLNAEAQCPENDVYTRAGHWGTITVSHVPEIIPWDGEVFTGGTYRHGEKIKRIRYSMRNGEYFVDMINGDYMRHPKFQAPIPHGHKYTPSNGDNPWYGYYQEPLIMMCAEDIPGGIITIPDYDVEVDPMDMIENIPGEVPLTDPMDFLVPAEDIVVYSTPVVVRDLSNKNPETENDAETGEIPSVQPTDEVLPEIVPEQITYLMTFPAGRKRIASSDQFGVIIFDGIVCYVRG